MQYEPLEKVRKELKVRWIRPKIERERLSELNQRSDLQGWFQAGGHLAIWLVTGAVVYYFWSCFRVAPDNGTAVDFTVPSGNFGNVCAGHVARMMGLPISRLVVATNEKDVLDEFFRTGLYRVRGRDDTFETSSPSMDISKASNLERFLFDLVGRDADRTCTLMSDRLGEHGSFDLGEDPVFAQAAERFGFRSGRSTHADRLATIRECWEHHQTLIDPHTADAVKVARAHAVPQTPMIVLETALPVKFAETIQEAVGQEPPRPARFDGLEHLPKRFKVLPADTAAVRAYVAQALQAEAR